MVSNRALTGSRPGIPDRLWSRPLRRSAQRLVIYLRFSTLRCNRLASFQPHKHPSLRPFRDVQLALSTPRSRPLLNSDGGSSDRSCLASTGTTSRPQATPWVVEGTPAARPCNNRHCLESCAASASSLAYARQRGSEIELFWPGL